MQVTETNNIKVYNLSHGKSLPEWLSERKRRQLVNKDADVRRRIELIQGFDMPTASTNLRVSKDGKYILAAGVYKPRIKCYDVSQLSLKFERCFDADIVKFDILSDDYSKMVFLLADRYVEFHAQYGRYYRTRMPKFGRDMSYNYGCCDLYLVGTGPDIYRLNLEQGRYLQPISSSIGQELNVCELNEVHQLLMVGSNEGKIQSFDPRTKCCVGSLDVGISAADQLQFDVLPSITALKFKDSLHYGIGLSSGQVLLYDLRSPKHLLVKDHYYCKPIKSIAFHHEADKVISCDEKVIKIWDCNTGKSFTSIEPNSTINDTCLYSNSGLIFAACESQKISTFYIPSLGTAPHWCSFLDNLTEELEESREVILYDDYKFVTKQELSALGLQDLVGTNLLRAYMHGYFMDIRLYHKAKSIVDPFAFDVYKKAKIKQQISAERENRVKLKKLPKVNRFLAEKLIDTHKTDVENSDTSKEAYKNPLADDRFGDLFKNPDFQIDQESEEYQHLHPVISKQDHARKKKIKGKEFHSAENDSSSSDDGDMWKELQQKRKAKKDLQKRDAVRFYELKSGQEFLTGPSLAKNSNTHPKKNETFEQLLEKRSSEPVHTDVSSTSTGNKEISFVINDEPKNVSQARSIADHKRERRALRRSAGDLVTNNAKKAVYWKGKRIK